MVLAMNFIQKKYMIVPTLTMYHYLKSK